MRAIKVYRSRRYTIVGLDEFKPGKDPALRKERVKELARRCGVRPGTRIELVKLGSGYSRFGDANRVGKLRAIIRLRRFDYDALAHELRHIAQGQQFASKAEWMEDYGSFSSTNARFDSKAYAENIYEIDAREHEALGDEIREWTP